jgi:hypothetical protein
MSSEQNSSAIATTGWLEIKGCFSVAVLRHMTSWTSYSITQCDAHLIKVEETNTRLFHWKSHDSTIV